MPFGPDIAVHAHALPTGKVRVPTLLVSGDHDLSTPLEWAREELKLVPHGKLVVVPGAGHSTQSRAVAGRVLLSTTLFRLVLNVASTRLILTRAGTAGTAAAGGIIQKFGELVAGDRVVVGAVIFAIIVII